jgi:peptide deformylase
MLRLGKVLRQAAGASGDKEKMFTLAHYPHMTLTRTAAAVLEQDRYGPVFQLRVQQLHQRAKELDVMSLSAPKLQWDAQVVLLKSRPDEEDYEVFVNPTVPGYDDATSVAPMYGMWETCVCCSQMVAWVIRPQQVVVTCSDEFGAQRTEVLAGMRSRLFQHEMDHLRGSSMMAKAPGTDFVASLAALRQRDQWPPAYPSMEAAMTPPMQFFDYVSNEVVTPAGVEWVTDLAMKYYDFQSRQLPE